MCTRSLILKCLLMDSLREFVCAGNVNGSFVVFQNKLPKLEFVILTLTISQHRITATGNYKFKVNNRNTSTRCEICSELTIKTPE